MKNKQYVAVRSMVWLVQHLEHATTFSHTANERKVNKVFIPWREEARALEFNFHYLVISRGLSVNKIILWVWEDLRQF